MAPRSSGLEGEGTNTPHHLPEQTTANKWRPQECSEGQEKVQPRGIPFPNAIRCVPFSLLDLATCRETLRRPEIKTVQGRKHTPPTVRWEGEEKRGKSPKADVRKGCKWSTGMAQLCLTSSLNQTFPNTMIMMMRKIIITIAITANVHRTLPVSQVLF